MLKLRFSKVLRWRCWFLAGLPAPTRKRVSLVVRRRLKVSTVTYKKQPAIHATRGAIPLQGTKQPYTVTDLLWPQDVHAWIFKRLKGLTLHICCGKSKVGHCRVDLNELGVDIRADAAKLPFSNKSWDTVLIDPPYNGVFQWNHDMLSVLARVARQRIIFQHWFLPIDSHSRFKKSNDFQLSEVAIWQGKTYFGRVQVISIIDSIQGRLL